jgi:TM2 domain-containing membrane protein YozV
MTEQQTSSETIMPAVTTSPTSIGDSSMQSISLNEVKTEVTETVQSDAPQTVQNTNVTQEQQVVNAYSNAYENVFGTSTTTYTNQQPAQVTSTNVAQVGEVKPDGKVTTPEQVMDPIIYAVVSWFVPGVSHYLLGQQQKGIAFLVFWLIEWIVLAALSFIFIGICLVPFAIAYHLLVAYDAFQIAKRVQDKQEIKEGECAHKYVTYVPTLSVFVKSEIFVKSPVEHVQTEQPAQNNAAPTEVIVQA